MTAIQNQTLKFEQNEKNKSSLDKFWTSLDMFGQVWTRFDKFEQVQTIKTNLAVPRGPCKAKPTPPARLLLKYP